MLAVRNKFLIGLVVILLVLSSLFIFYEVNTKEGLSFWRMNVHRGGYSDVTIPSDSPIQENFGVGLYEFPDYSTGGTPKRAFKINGTFEKYLLIANAINKSREYLVFVLVDYIQTPFYVNNSLNITHSIVLKPMEYKFLKIKITNISEGYHDVFIGVFLDPYNHNLSDRYRLSTDFSMMGGIRIQVISGRPIYTLPIFRDPPITCETKGALDGILLTKTPCKYLAWLRENASDNIKYYINIGEQDKNIQTFALVAMLDYKQVPIRNDTIVYFGYTFRNQDIAIPANLEIKNKTQEIHEFIVLYFTDPFLPIEFPPDVRNINLELTSEPSIRVAILPEAENK